MRHTPSKLALIYGVASGLWIIISSEFVLLEVMTPAAITRWEIIKGLVFIAASGAFIYGVTRRLTRRLMMSQESLRRAETNAQLLQKEVSQANKLEALGRLASGIAHDFNNFLEIISAHAHLMEKEINASTRSSHVSAIIDTAQQAARLTRQLLTFSRSQAFETAPVNLTTTVHQIGTLLKRLVGSAINLRLTLEPHLWNVIADADQMNQVVMNLCLNARDAMPHGGSLEVGTENVLLGAELARRLPESVPGPSVLLTVKDNGTGIPMEVRDKMFEPFFTTKYPGKGTGLGLSIVYGIVKHHKGVIDVISEEGKGTAFKIYFPAAVR
jgi:two-component system, cell cycle sensor histidine kinase and response regulator CckA